VKASIDEAMKLERAMSQLRTAKRVVVLHYAPIAATVTGEAPEIYRSIRTWAVHAWLKWWTDTART